MRYGVVIGAKSELFQLNNLGRHNMLLSIPDNALGRRVDLIQIVVKLIQVEKRRSYITKLQN